MAETRLTQTAIVRLPVPTEGVSFHWDTELPCFGVKVLSTGSKSYVIQYRNPSGKSRRLKIADAVRMPIGQAREQARKLLAEVSLGNDPAEAKKHKKEVLSIADMLELYFKEYVSGMAKNTREDSARMFKNHIQSAIGKRLLTDIKRSDLRELHRKITAGGKPVSADTAIALVVKAWRWASREEVKGVPTPPTMEKFPWNGTEERTRVLSADEYARLYAVIQEHHLYKKCHSGFLFAIEYLLITGVRKSECVALRWSNIQNDWIESTDKVADSKIVFMTTPLRNLLKRIKEWQSETGESEWIFPSALRRGVAAQADMLNDVLGRLTVDAKIDGLIVHDMRRSYLDVARKRVIFDEKLIASVIGHTNTQTMRKFYNGKNIDAELKIAEAIATDIWNMLTA